jgi:DNA-directed RNA polymerase subunit RPC12/RpoP
MTIESLSCNSCGAPLEVPQSANYITCNYCKARLTVKRTGSTAYTEVLDTIAGNTDQMAGDLRFMRLRHELELLDADWAQKSEELARQRKADGIKLLAAKKKTEPSIFAVGLAIVGVLLLFQRDAFLFGLVLIGVALLISISMKRPAERKYKELQQEISRRQDERDIVERQYRNKRREIEEGLRKSIQPR